MRQEKQVELDAVVDSRGFNIWWEELGEVLACGIPEVESERLREICAIAFESGMMSILKAMAEAFGDEATPGKVLEGNAAEG